MIGEFESAAFLEKVFTVILAGAGGGLVASVATCPLDVVKTKLQAQRAVRGQQGYRGVIGMYPHRTPHRLPVRSP
jgi:hypothetical protein